MNENRQGQMENLLDGFNQHAQLLSDEELKNELGSRGIDVNGFLAEAHAIASYHQQAERLKWMKVADEKKRSITDAQRTWESWLGKGERAIADAWAAFLATASPNKALAFRNKTDLTTEDKARILDDYERLRLRQLNNEPKRGS